MIVPRDYQNEACDKSETILLAGRSCLVVMPTGTGKTTVIGETVRRFLGRFPDKKVMVYAHTEELIDQLAERIRLMNPSVEVGIEMGEQTCVGQSQWMFGQSRVIVGTRQTICNRLNGFDPSGFCLLIPDEAHHAVSRQNTRIINHFAGAKLMGVTATPDRGDEVRLSKVFEEVAYQMTVPDAIALGWLTPVRQQFVEIDGLDFTAAKKEDGDYSDEKLDKILAAEPRAAHEIAAATVASCPGQTLVFCPGVEMSKLVSDIINRYPGETSEYVVGETNKNRRREIIAAYRRGDLKRLVGCGVFLEGFDAPETRHLVNARPFRKRYMYAQMVGRVMRALPGVVDGPPTAEARIAAIAASAKPFGHVIDLTSASSEHELVFSGDILGGKEFPKGVRAAALKKAKKASGPVDLLKLMEMEEARFRAEQLERERRKVIRAEAKITFHEVGTGGQTGHTAVNSPMATAKMRAYLAKRGYDTDGMTKAQAGVLIGKIKKADQTGQASPKQQDILRKHGLPADVNKTTASVLIDLTVARGWQAPDYTPTKDLWKILPQDGGFRAVVNDPDFGGIVLRKDREPFRSIEECRAYFAPVFDQLPSLV